MVQTFLRMRAADPGFTSQGVVTVSVSLANRQYTAPEKQTTFFEEVLRRVRALPGVRSVGACDELPPSDNVHGSGIHFADRPEPKPNDVQIALRDSATPDYFRAMDVRILRGRAFTDVDGAAGPPVAIVNQRFAEKFWPGDDPIRPKAGSAAAPNSRRAAR